MTDGLRLPEGWHSVPIPRPDGSGADAYPTIKGTDVEGFWVMHTATPMTDTPEKLTAHVQEILKQFKPATGSTTKAAPHHSATQPREPGTARFRQSVFRRATTKPKVGGRFFA